uniref:C2H2-type domain-containing protein n=1 Tax=Strongyloides venezuelensis TaxID=75913 RepID=A0A0K0F1F7_STRVS
METRVSDQHVKKNNVSSAEKKKGKKSKCSCNSKSVSKKSKCTCNSKSCSKKFRNKKNKNNLHTREEDFKPTLSDVSESREVNGQLDARKSVTIENIRVFGKPKSAALFITKDDSETVSKNSKVDKILGKIKQDSDKKGTQPKTYPLKNKTVEIGKINPKSNRKTIDIVSVERTKILATQSIDMTVEKKSKSPANIAISQESKTNDCSIEIKVVPKSCEVTTSVENNGNENKVREKSDNFKKRRLLRRNKKGNGTLETSNNVTQSTVVLPKQDEYVQLGEVIHGDIEKLLNDVKPEEQKKSPVG